MPDLTRTDIITALRRELEPLDYVYAMWEAGAVAFNRFDTWSDIDLQIDAADDRTAEVFATVESVFATLSSLETLYELPQPTWHGHAQIFYRLERTSPFLIIDLVVMKNSNTNKFFQPAIHGMPLVHFDKRGVVKWQPFDSTDAAARIADRLHSIRSSFDLFQTLTRKELNRGNSIEAIAFYHNFTLRPLVELLRIRHCPVRAGFHTRYIQYDLPPAVVSQLESLYYIQNPADLEHKQQQAIALAHALLEEIDLTHITSILDAARAAEPRT